MLIMDKSFFSRWYFWLNKEKIKNFLKTNEWFTENSKENTNLNYQATWEEIVKNGGKLGTKIYYKKETFKEILKVGFQEIIRLSKNTENKENFSICETQRRILFFFIENHYEKWTPNDLADILDPKTLEENPLFGELFLEECPKTAEKAGKTVLSAIAKSDINLALEIANNKKLFLQLEQDDLLTIYQARPYYHLTYFLLTRTSLKENDLPDSNNFHNFIQNYLTPADNGTSTERFRDEEKERVRQNFINLTRTCAPNKDSREAILYPNSPVNMGQFQKLFNQLQPNQRDIFFSCADPDGNLIDFLSSVFLKNPSLTQIIFEKYPEDFAKNLYYSEELSFGKKLDFLIANRAWLKAEHYMAFFKRLHSIDEKERFKYFLQYGATDRHQRTTHAISDIFSYLFSFLKSIFNKNIPRQNFVFRKLPLNQIKTELSESDKNILLSSYPELNLEVNNENPKNIVLDEKKWQIHCQKQNKPKVTFSNANTSITSDPYIQARQKIDDLLKNSFRTTKVLTDYINSPNSISAEEAWYLATKYWEYIKPKKKWFQNKKNYEKELNAFADKNIFFQYKIWQEKNNAFNQSFNKFIIFANIPFESLSLFAKNEFKTVLQTQINSSLERLEILMQKRIQQNDLGAAAKYQEYINQIISYCVFQISDQIDQLGVALWSFKDQLTLDTWNLIDKEVNLAPKENVENQNEIENPNPQRHSANLDPNNKEIIKTWFFRKIKAANNSQNDHNNNDELNKELEKIYLILLNLNANKTQKAMYILLIYHVCCQIKMKLHIDSGFVEENFSEFEQTLPQPQRTATI